MTIKQSKLVNAYNATEKLADDSTLSRQDKWKVFNLRKKLSPNMEFQTESEDKLKEKYAPFANENGVITGQTYQDYTKELNEIGKVEVDVGEIEKIKLPLTDSTTVRIMEALEDFIAFDEGEEKHE